MDPSWTSIHLGFLWDTSEGTVALPEDKTTWVEEWAIRLLESVSTTQEDLESLVGTLISTHTAVWKAPLHLRYLQRMLLFSLKQGINPQRSILVSQPMIRNLEWWASGGLRSNRVSPWRLPQPTLHIWSDVSPKKGSAHTDSGKFFQYYWSDQEARKHINWQELRDAKMVLLRLTSPSNFL